MKIAVMGIGSLGTVVGALLAEGGLDVVLVDADEKKVEVLNAEGAKLTGNLDLVQPVRAVTPDGLDGIYDLVVYLVKSTYDERALPQVAPHLGADSVLITLQNGVPEEKVASFIGRERTMGGAVMWSAELTSPGVSRMTSDPDQMGYEIGELDGAVAERIKEVKGVLDHAGTANITENLAGVRWSKLLFNVGASGVSAALGAMGGEIMDDDKASDTVLYIMIETILTAGALGITLEPLRGVDPVILLDLARQDMGNLRNLLRNVIGDFRTAKASMLQDLEKGLPCEVESINGYLSAMAAQAGVAVPVNDQVTQIIRDIQDGRRKLRFSNLDLIELPPVSDYF